MKYFRFTLLIIPAFVFFLVINSSFSDEVDLLSGVNKVSYHLSNFQDGAKYCFSEKQVGVRLESANRRQVPKPGPNIPDYSFIIYDQSELDIEEDNDKSVVSHYVKKSLVSDLKNIKLKNNSSQKYIVFDLSSTVWRPPQL